MRIKEALEELKPYIVKKRYENEKYSVEFNCYIVLIDKSRYTALEIISYNPIFALGDDYIKVNIEGVAFTASKRYFFLSSQIKDLVYIIPSEEEVREGKMRKVVDELNVI